MRADPIGLDGGINPYVYTENNPINFFDVDGLTPEQALAVWQGFVTNPNSLQYGVARPKSMWNPTPVYSLPFTDQFKNRLLYQDSKGVDVTAYSDEQLACEYQKEVQEQFALVGMAAGVLSGGGYAGPKNAKYGATPQGRPYSRHYALETGPERNIPGSVVDETINTGSPALGGGGKTVYYDPINDMTVVTGRNGIIRAHKGPPRPGQF